jgi:hypothetical protein
MGGDHGISDNNCNGATGVSECNDVQYTSIGANATLGGFSGTSSFSSPRTNFSAMAENGYVYIVSGSTFAVDAIYSDIQSAQINSGGTLGSFSNAGTLGFGRVNFGLAPYNGRMYIVGGGDGALGFCSGGQCNDVIYASVSSPAQSAVYERNFDVGDIGTNVVMDSITINGQGVCGFKLRYRSAGSDGVFGSSGALFASTGNAATLAITNKRYLWVQYTLDDQYCGTNSNITDITLTWHYNAPDAPTLSAPANAATGQSLTPQFQMRSPQANNSYLQYKIEVCSTNNCSSVVRTIDQTSSQTGWSGQDQQTSTAYTGNVTITSSTMATHTYQTPALSYNTQYWWRAYAIDPAKSNTFSSASSIYTFYTNYTPTPTLISPTNNQSGVSVTPDLRVSATDQDGDYIRFKIEICASSNCSVILRTIDQTSSQTGWTGQSQQSNTAYGSGEEARHDYQLPALIISTQYWWRAYAIDPGGTNLWSNPTSIQTFTTGTTPSVGVILRGGTTIRGGTGL